MPTTLSTVYEFEELGLIDFRDGAGVMHRPWIYARGRAHIDFSSRNPEDWSITGIQIDQGSARDHLPMVWLSSTNDAAIYALVETALKQHRSDDIGEAILAEIEGEQPRFDPASEWGMLSKQQQGIR